MYAQAAIKPNTSLHNGAYGIVMRGVQKCTCAGASLRGRNFAPLCCIKLDTATDCVFGRGGLMRYRTNRRTGDDMAKEHYLALEKNASDCISCGHCNSRCPFSVDQMNRMQEIKGYFG